MEPTDLTIEILKGIREEGRKTNESLTETNERITETNERITETNERITETNERLERLRQELTQRIVDSELRTATALTELALAVRDVAGLMRAANDLRPRLEKCEQEIVLIKERLPDA